MDVTHYYYHLIQLYPQLDYSILVQRPTDKNIIYKEIDRLNRKHNRRVSPPQVQRITIISSKIDFLQRLRSYASTLKLDHNHLFVLSCHGYSGPLDRRQSESDGRNEYIHVMGQTVLDDELFDHLVQHVPTQSTLYTIVDTCSSGTMLDLPYRIDSNGNITNENKLNCKGGQVYCWSACNDHQSDPDDLSTRYGYSGGLSAYVLDHVDWSISWEANTCQLFQHVPNLVVSLSRPVRIRGLQCGSKSKASGSGKLAAQFSKFAREFGKSAGFSKSIIATTDANVIVSSTPESSSISSQSIDYTPMIIATVIVVGLMLTVHGRK
jgi:hypothetical protein